MTGKLSKNFHGVGIGPLSKIYAVKGLGINFGPIGRLGRMCDSAVCVKSEVILMYIHMYIKKGCLFRNAFAQLTFGCLMNCFIKKLTH